MLITLCIIIIFITYIIYSINIIEKQKIKIIYLSRKNEKLNKKLNGEKNFKNNIENFKNTEIKFININSEIAYLKNTSFIKIAPFDFAPKIIDIKKNTEIKIISKILILNEYWYEILTNNNDNSYTLKGWVKEHNIDLIYKNSELISSSNIMNTNKNYSF